MKYQKQVDAIRAILRQTDSTPEIQDINISEVICEVYYAARKEAFEAARQIMMEAFSNDNN